MVRDYAAMRAASVPVVKVEPDRNGNPDRVLITDERGQRVTMSFESFRDTCRLAPDAQILVAL